MFTPPPPYPQFAPQYQTHPHSMPTNNGQAMGYPTGQIAMNGQFPSGIFNMQPPQLFSSMAQSSPAYSHAHPFMAQTSLPGQGYFTTPPRQEPEQNIQWPQYPSLQYARVGTLPPQIQGLYPSPTSMSSPIMNFPQTQGAAPAFQFNLNQHYGGAMVPSPTAQYAQPGGQLLYQPPVSMMTSPSPFPRKLGEMSTPTKRPRSQCEAGMAPPPAKRIRSDPEAKASMLRQFTAVASGVNSAANTPGIFTQHPQLSELRNASNRRHVSDPSSNSTLMQQEMSNLVNPLVSHPPALPVIPTSTSFLPTVPVAISPSTTSKTAPARGPSSPDLSISSTIVPIAPNLHMSTQTSGPTSSVTLAPNPLTATQSTASSPAAKPLDPARHTLTPATTLTRTTNPVAPASATSTSRAPGSLSPLQVMAPKRLASLSIPTPSLEDIQCTQIAPSHPIQRLSPNRRLGIAISGCTSSGKTTLAYLLAAVFSGPESLIKSLGTSEPKIKEWEGVIMPKTLILRQDDFFKSKDKCPKVNWGQMFPPPELSSKTRVSTTAREQTHRDTHWAKACELNVGIKPGQIWDAESHHYPEQPSPQPVVLPKEGPNTDCREAVDWERVQESLSDSAIDGKVNVVDVCEEHKKILECLKRIQPRVIQILRARIDRWVVEQTELNAKAHFNGRSVVKGNLRDLLLVDGFLLYLLDNGNINGDFQGTQALMRDCEVNIFLPTTKEVAKKRRFQRPEYQDAPIGGRLPEQKWKTEEYFDQVAWSEYEKENAWIFQGKDVEDKSLYISAQAGENRISVMPEMDADIPKTLVWAVEMILMSLLHSETEARNNYVQHQETLEQDKDRLLGTAVGSGTDNSALVPSKVDEACSSPVSAATADNDQQ